MEFSFENAVPILRRTPAVLRAMLWDVPERWARATEGPDTWSPFDIVGHLIHGDRTDWIARLEIILTQGATRPFVPFDRFAQFQESRGKSLHQLLDTFAELRAANIDRLESHRLSSKDLERRGTHPELGPVTLGELLATWVVHDLSHIAQIARVMGKQYAEAVGPWRAYLPMLGDHVR
jgi:hypothetical protein